MSGPTLSKFMLTINLNPSPSLAKFFPPVHQILATHPLVSSVPLCPALHGYYVSLTVYQDSSQLVSNTVTNSGPGLYLKNVFTKLQQCLQNMRQMHAGNIIIPTTHPRSEVITIIAPTFKFCHAQHQHTVDTSTSVTSQENYTCSHLSYQPLVITSDTLTPADMPCLPSQYQVPTPVSIHSG